MWKDVRSIGVTMGGTVKIGVAYGFQMGTV